jgi:hypothetical protein
MNRKENYKGRRLYRNITFHLKRYAMSNINNETLLENLYEEALDDLKDSGLSIGAARRVAEKLAKQRFENHSESVIDKSIPPDAFD